MASVMMAALVVFQGNDAAEQHVMGPVRIVFKTTYNVLMDMIRPLDIVRLKGTHAANHHYVRLVYFLMFYPSRPSPYE